MRFIDGRSGFVHSLSDYRTAKLDSLESEKELAPVFSFDWQRLSGENHRLREAGPSELREANKRDPDAAFYRGLGARLRASDPAQIPIREMESLAEIMDGCPEIRGPLRTSSEADGNGGEVWG